MRSVTKCSFCPLGTIARDVVPRKQSAFPMRNNERNSLPPRRAATNFKLLERITIYLARLFVVIPVEIHRKVRICQSDSRSTQPEILKRNPTKRAQSHLARSGPRLTAHNPKTNQDMPRRAIHAAFERNPPLTVKVFCQSAWMSRSGTALAAFPGCRRFPIHGRKGSRRGIRRWQVFLIFLNDVERTDGSSDRQPCWFC